MFNKVIVRNENDFVVNVNPLVYGSGYNVVPKSVDPWNKYDIEEVRTYVANNPDMVVAELPIPLVEELPIPVVEA